MLLLGHLTKFRRQSEVVVLDFRESLPVACVLCLQQRIAQLNDGALVRARVPPGETPVRWRKQKLSAGVKSGPISWWISFLTLDARSITNR
jgi:hypothetical protein